jgi:hypothetical protein
MHTICYFSLHHFSVSLCFLAVSLISNAVPYFFPWNTLLCYPLFIHGVAWRKLLIYILRSSPLLLLSPYLIIRTRIKPDSVKELTTVPWCFLAKSKSILRNITENYGYDEGFPELGILYMIVIIMSWIITIQINHNVLNINVPTVVHIGLW